MTSFFSRLRALTPSWLIAFLIMAIASPWANATGSAGETRGMAVKSLKTQELAPVIEGRYIVVLREPALASYRGNRSGFAAPERRAGRRGGLNVRGPASRSYVNRLQGQQSTLESRMSRAFKRPVTVSRRMQHAVNGMVMDLSPSEAAQLAAQPEVLLVEPDRLLPLNTDIGPGLIGAPAIWQGSDPNLGGAAQGEGMVIGVIDTGINFGSPSFAALGPVDNHLQVNPLGEGVYLGTCAAGGVDEGRCNAKLIGGYDFVCQAPGNMCGSTNVREEPGFGDTDGHGTHVASTVAGHRRVVSQGDLLVNISGVAPHAAIVAYDVCYTNTSTGRGSCPVSSSIAAINQAVADEVVDAINYSISGGDAPWSDTVSLAMLGAVEAGIYIATSAGNSGPGAETVGHRAPWVAATAATQHGRSAFAPSLEVTGPAPVPAELTQLSLSRATGGGTLTAPIPSTTPLRISAGIDTNHDGCSAYPAGTFTGAIAVIRRGTCSFSIKVNHADDAGALAVILVNNVAGEFIPPSVLGSTLPAFGLAQSTGNTLRDFGRHHPSEATAGLTSTVSQPNAADQLADFSSRGPATGLSLIKPDLTAPGVNILAAYAGNTLTGHEDSVESISGTSMASPHHAGAALLVRQLRPDWSVPEVKSALQMSALRSVVLEDGQTPATPFDMGSGRIRVDRAANAGLVLHETPAAFTAANPATGGDPATLNLASMANADCWSTCHFVRTFRNTTASTMSWNASVAGINGTVTPANFTVAAGALVTLNIAIPSTPNAAFQHGWLELKRQGGAAAEDLNLPIAIYAPPPAASLTPAHQALSLIAGESRSISAQLSSGNAHPLTFASQSAGTGLLTLRDTGSLGISSGFRATLYSDPITAPSQAQFAADDLVLNASTRLREISVEGFTVSTKDLANASPHITWSIYPDASGLPAGNPVTSPSAALWQFTTPTASAGVTTIGDHTIRLNLQAAGQTVELPAGRYWVMLHTHSSFADRFAWYASNTAHGHSGFATISIASNGSGNWTTNTEFAGLHLRVTGEVACGTSWLSNVTPASGTVLRDAPQAISATVGPLPAGTYSGALCLASDDPDKPTLASAIELTVTPSSLAFTTPPSSTATAGVPFAIQPVVTVQDAALAPLTTAVDPITLSLASGAGTLSCTQNPVTPVNGVASFAGCSVDTPGTVTLTATSSSSTASASHPEVVVAAGTPAALTFATAPSSSVSAGTPFAVQPVIHLEDGFGHRLPTATDAVTLSIASGTGTLLCDSNTVTAVQGIASFSGCTLNTAGTVTLNASTASIPNSTSQPSVLVTAGAASQLAFTTMPPESTDSGALWLPQPAITVQDAFGNVVDTAATPITLALASGSGTLSCAANPVMPIAGIAQFAGCKIEGEGVITLNASTSGITSSTSAPQMHITAGAPRLTPVPAVVDRWSLLLLGLLMFATCYRLTLGRQQP